MRCPEYYVFLSWSKVSDWQYWSCWHSFLPTSPLFCFNCALVIVCHVLPDCYFSQVIVTLSVLLVSHLHHDLIEAWLIITVTGIILPLFRTPNPFSRATITAPRGRHHHLARYLDPPQQKPLKQAKCNCEFLREAPKRTTSLVRRIIVGRCVRATS